MSEYGKVALVGAGPGDSGLLTLRGAELIRKADCIVYDRLASKEFLELSSGDCEKIYVGKENHHHTMDQDSINELLFEKAKEYELVVRLKGGDPYVFGRGGEEALFLTDRNVEVEVVPGVTSAVAAAELAGIPVTHRGLSKGFQVITAHSRKDSLSDIDFSKLTDEDITLVFLMGLSHVEAIAEELIKVGRALETPVAVISNGTIANQRKCIGTLENIGSLVKEAGLVSPAIIVVGKVVSLSENLSLFENRPLFGRKFFLPVIQKFEYSLGEGIVTRRNELEKVLTEKGAKVISVVSGRIAPTEFDLGFLDEIKPSDVIAFTSASGVNTFFYSLLNGGERDLRSLPDCTYAAIGDKTAKALLEFGIKADVVSEGFTSVEFAGSLSRYTNDKDAIYWICGKRHSQDLEKGICSGAAIKPIVCYENVPVAGESLNGQMADSNELIKEISSCDGTILTCGSNARFAVKNLGNLPGDVYSIGPACSKVLRSLGVTNVNEALEASYEGIIRAVQNSN